MKKQFQWDKFIIDCFLCFGLMVVSYVVFFFPIISIYELINFTSIYIFDIKFHLGEIDILNGFGNYALFCTLCHIFFFGIWFFLEKKAIMIKYKIYKLSFCFIFVLFTSFWWYLSYWLSHNFYK